jgi:predicted ATP-grasp superfamily ATP-dependent carboligase
MRTREAEPARVLIPDPTDLPQTAALRGLSRRGDICDVFWTYGQGTERFFNSRYRRRIVAAPVSADSDPTGFAGAVVAQVRTGAYDVVLPTRGSSLEALLTHRDMLAEYAAILMPTAEQFRLGIDKQATVEFCRTRGVAYPETVYVDAHADDLDRHARRVGYPAVLKHPRNFGGSRGVRMVCDLDGLADAAEQLRELPGVAPELMLQGFLPGNLIDACLVAKDGRIGGLVLQERRLMKPISGGVACVLSTLELPELESEVSRIIELLGWTGPAQLEFKWDPERRRFALIEINPRVWATTGAWLGAGANFPALAVDLALGREPAPFPRLPPNLRFVYLMGRAPIAFCQLWRAKGFRALRDSRHYTRTWYDFDGRDPVPDLYRLYRELRGVKGGWNRLKDDTLPATLIPAFP